MSRKFEAALPIVLRWEGGLSRDPHDRGGTTKWGVSLRAILSLALDFNNDGKVNEKDILDMSREQMQRFYRQHYWDLCSCDELPCAVALVVFDCAVNQGPSRAKRFLQKALGVRVDGIIGPKTISAAWEKYPGDTVRDFCARRALHYSSLSQIVRYGYGWFRRLFDIHKEAVLWQRRNETI